MLARSFHEKILCRYLNFISDEILFHLNGTYTFYYTVYHTAVTDTVE